ncbi:MAG: hypothetical protein PHN72_06460 [Bacilli bacterium]|nr:hypothetical protein [Bacilli bacterium]
MNELTNYATATGIYNNLETEVQSNETTTILTNNLEIIMEVNKSNWYAGTLLYTITIRNNTESTFENQDIQKIGNTFVSAIENIVITDVLDVGLVSLLVESVRIDGIPAGYGIFTYNPDTGVLIFRLPRIESGQEIVINFQVVKKGNEIFRLDNYATLTFEGNTILSNTVTVFALSEICRCQNIND